MADVYVYTNKSIPDDGSGVSAVPKGITALSVLSEPPSASRFISDYNLHAEMVQRATSSSSATPILYMRTIGTRDRYVSTNSGGSALSVAAHEHYDRVESDLQSLSNSGKEPPVEEGAITSALAVVAELRRAALPPPRLSWHGDDAVVMLWAVGDTTAAITVTDGELGYVVRRNRKAIKIADSLSVARFQLEDLR